MVFHDVVFQAIVEKEGLMDETSDTVEEQEQFQVPEFIGTALDLTKRNIQELPKELVERSCHVQYLYLEGNLLCELPQDLFEQLYSLKWLDVRMNRLTELPTPGLSGHPRLETILLQGNLIKALPFQLGNIPNLRGLQASGNPITNIPFETLTSGFYSIMRYLRQLQGQHQGLQPVSDTVIRKSKADSEETIEQTTESTSLGTDDLEFLDYSRPKRVRKKKARALAIQDPVSTALSVVGYSGTTYSWGNAPAKQHKTSMICTGSKTARYNTRLHKKSENKSGSRLSRLGYRCTPLTMQEVQERTIRQVQRAQLTETLQRQAQVLQRMKDAALLKEWRKQNQQTPAQLKLLDNYQQYPCKDFSNKTPFDVDPDFLNMLSRVDLYRTLKEMDSQARKKRTPSLQLSPSDLENQMSEVLKKLEHLNVEFDENQPAERKKIALSDKMTKITKLQKFLRKLQSQNEMIGSTSTGISRKNVPFYAN